MEESQVRLVPLAAKTVVCHTVTYFCMGILAYHFLHYQEIINNPCSGMRPITNLWVILGTPMQIFRGLLFASVIRRLRSTDCSRRSMSLRSFSGSVLAPTRTSVTIAVNARMSFSDISFEAMRNSW